MANVLVISETPQRVIIRDEAATRTVKVVALGPQGPSGNVNPLMFEMLDQANAASRSASISATAAGEHYAATSILAGDAEASAASALASQQSSTTSAESATQSAASASASATTAISSASSASLSASSANTSATNAQASANTATSKASDAATSATAAQGAAAGVQANAEASASSAAAAAASKSAAATSASNAASSATAAANSAASASSSATSASGSAATSATKASEASTSAANAAVSATTATTKASEASTSASNAATSATSAANSASAASASAAAAASSKSAAAASATNASDSATSASNSATAAATSATSASNSAAGASTSATNADSSAATAATKASEAAASATNAADSAAAASASKTQSEALVNGLNALARPDIRPSLLLDFANSKRLDSRITFTRASTATYWDGKTFAKAEENLLKYSQEFDNASWIKTNATVTANSTTAPDGTTTADTLLEAATTTTHTGYQAVYVAAAQYFFSVYLKDAGRSFALVAVGVNAVSVNLTLGTVSAANGTTSDRTIQSVGGGWYRVNFSVTTTAGNNDFVIYTSTDGVWANRVYAGDITKGLYLWGAKLEQRSQATAYTPTTSAPITKYQPVLQTAASGVPRIDHDPVTGECKGLLIEEQRTNLLTYSEQFDNAAWYKLGGAITANVAPSPDGAIGADRLTEDTSTNLHIVYRVVPVTSGKVYTLSYWVKRGVGSRDLSIRMDSDASSRRSAVNLSTGAISANASHTVTVRPFGSYWYVTCTVTATATTSVVVGAELNVAGVGSSYAGDGTSSIDIWGAQLEEGAFATSYIPTVASQVTRAADAAVITGANFSSWYRQDEGTFFSETRTSATSRAGVLQVHGSGVSSNPYGKWDVRYGNSTNMSTAGALNQVPLAGVFNKSGFSFASMDFSHSVNGAAPSTATSYTLGEMNRLYIGYFVAGDYLNGHIRRIAYYPKRLSNDTLQALTAQNLIA